ncbi:hypothetical protein AAMO2058_000636100 [Amorphochlora amoebiformis]|uniref:Uncharacterized protein n=1 Tax=Amorphochlora amoebiformis TaxID=1561963 RepID=A0A7S0DRZ1_9EUKA|mmetsp:Transcript_670/g.949  ORF Transcript_670/g.949 Transcript_670/m.949 type:complete len:234 (+) Transcript_670:75-776(+)
MTKGFGEDIPGQNPRLSHRYWMLLSFWVVALFITSFSDPLKLQSALSIQGGREGSEKLSQKDAERISERYNELKKKIDEATQRILQVNDEIYEYSLLESNLNKQKNNDTVLRALGGVLIERTVIEARIEVRDELTKLKALRSKSIEQRSEWQADEEDMSRKYGLKQASMMDLVNQKASEQALYHRMQLENMYKQKMEELSHQNQQQQQHKDRGGRGPSGRYRESGLGGDNVFA